MATSVGGASNPLNTVDGGDGGDNNSTDNNNNRTISAADALARAGQLSHGDWQYPGWCSKFVQDAALGDTHSALGHADVWYNRVKSQGAVNTTKAPPAGVAVFYDTNNEHDHVALSAGNGYVWSTGINGRIQRVPIDNLYGSGPGSTPNRGWTSRFGNQYINYNKSGLTSSGSSVSSVSSSDAAKPKPSASAQAAPQVPHAAASAMESDLTPTAPSSDLTSLSLTRPASFSTGAARQPSIGVSY